MFATYLVVVDPSDAVKVADGPHVFGQIFGQRPLEIVDDGDDFAVGFQSGDDFSVDPILPLVVAQAAIERVGRQHQQEIFGLADELQEIVVEFAGLQALDVNEDGKVPQLEVDCTQGGRINQTLEDRFRSQFFNLIVSLPLSRLASCDPVDRR